MNDVQLRPKGQENNLSPSDLATQINQAHEACCRAAGQALDHAMKCGDLLAQAKAGCAHGQWQQWLKDNFAGSDRTAQAYMRLAANREAIESKAQRSAVLSIHGALKLIRNPPAPLFPTFDADLPPELFEAECAAAQAATVIWAADRATRIERATLEELQSIQAEASSVVHGWAEVRLRCRRQIGLLLRELEGAA